MKDMHPFEYSYEDMRTLSLTPEERADMRANLREFMAEHPVRQNFFEKLLAPRGRSRGYMRPALAGALIVVLVGGSTSYAAADALPGEFLYTVKINVNEPIASALAFTAEAKASHSASLAVRRLEEAEMLASEGRLSSDARIELEAKFEEHVTAFEDKTIALAQSEESIETIAEVQSDLEASLNVHAAVLAELSAIIPEIERDLKPIQEKVAARAEAIQIARTLVEGVIATKVDDDIRKAASEKKRIAEREVSERRSSRVAAKAPEPQPEAATMMMAAFVAEDAATTTSDPVIDAFDEGSAALEIGKYGEAFTKFQGAIRTIKEEKLKEDVRSRLNFNVGDKKGDGRAFKKDKEDIEVDRDTDELEEDNKADNDNSNGSGKREDDTDEHGDNERQGSSTLESILPEQLRNVVPGLGI